MPDKKVKFLIIGQTPPPYGGQSINIGKIVSFLERNSFETKLLRMNFSEEMNETGKFGFQKIFKLFQLCFNIFEALLIYKPDYVYYPPSGFERVPVYRDIILLLIVKIFKAKRIFHFHAGGLSNIYPVLNPVMRKLFEIAFFNPEYSICMSLAGKKDPLFLNCKNIVLIPYGVDNILQPKSNKVLTKFTILFVGVCRESKGILDFIKIVRSAHIQNNHIGGRVVGKPFGNLEEQALQQAVNEGIITFEGVKIGAEKVAIFNESDLFLFPTFFEHENFPTVNLEAFSCGLPVISTKWRGVVDQIQDGLNGYLYEPHDIEGMASAIVNLAGNNGLYSELSQHARDSYSKLYSNEIFEQNIVNFFKSLK